MTEVTLRSVTAFLLAIALLACGSTPKKEPAPLPADEPEPPTEEAAPAPTTTTVSTDNRPASTATFEEAMSVPEPLDVKDAKTQLTDAQLTSPMKGIIDGCKLPTNVHVTIKTAVQNGRAIGVTVTVRIDRPPPKTKRPPPRAQVKADQKLSAKVGGCVDKAVREQSWPPSKRRDSFTTEF